MTTPWVPSAVWSASRKPGSVESASVQSAGWHTSRFTERSVNGTSAPNWAWVSAWPARWPFTYSSTRYCSVFRHRAGIDELTRFRPEYCGAVVSTRGTTTPDTSGMATHAEPDCRKYHSAERVWLFGSYPVFPPVSQNSVVGVSWAWTPVNDASPLGPAGWPAANEATTYSLNRFMSAAASGFAARRASRSLRAPDTHGCSNGGEFRGCDGSPWRYRTLAIASA